MEADVELNCLSLSGSKVLRSQRPKVHKTNGRSTPDNEKGERGLYLSTRIMQHPVTPPNSPLVMQMYNHKKARDSVMKRVWEQRDRGKKKRLVYLKTTSVLGLITNSGQSNTSKSKETTPKRSQNSDSVTNSNRPPKLLPRIDSKNTNLIGRDHLRRESKNDQLRAKPLFRQNKQQRNDGENKYTTDKSYRRIQFNVDTINNNNNNKNNHNNENNNSNDNNMEKDINIDNEDDENDDSKSDDSIAIQSIFLNNRNYDEVSDKNPSPPDATWSHRNVPKNIPWPQMQETYKGYFYKDNGEIVLTRKYQPVSNSYPNMKTRAETNGNQTNVHKRYRWGYMDPGRLLNKQISSLSITGTHA